MILVGMFNEGPMIDRTVKEIDGDRGIVVDRYSNGVVIHTYNGQTQKRLFMSLEAADSLIKALVESKAKISKPDLISWSMTVTVENKEKTP